MSNDSAPYNECPYCGEETNRKRYHPPETRLCCSEIADKTRVWSPASPPQSASLDLRPCVKNLQDRIKSLESRLDDHRL